MKQLILTLLAVLVSGCGLTVPSGLEPAFDNISGTYNYSGLGELKPYQFPNPLIDLKDIQNPSEVDISHIDGRIQASYVTRTGKPVARMIDLNEKRTKGVSWKGQVMVTTKEVPITGPRILPLPVKHYRGTRIFRNADGNLCIIGFFKEEGLFFTDYWEDELVLKRTGGRP